MATIGSLVFKIGADTAEILDGVNKVNAKLGTMPAELERVQSRTAAWGSFVGNVMADVAAKVASTAIKAIGDLVERSEQMSAVSYSFDRLSSSAGMAGEELLKMSRGATKGLVSDFDLMLAANKAMVLGLPVTSSSFSTLTEAAITLGRAMGLGPVKSINDLVEGLGKGSPEVLNNLGIIVKAEDAYKRYGAQIKKLPDALTAAEKQTAVYNMAMDVAQKKVADLGGIQDRSVDIITRVKVAWDNLLNNVAKAIERSPVLRDLLSGLSDAMQTWIDKLSTSVDVTAKVDSAIISLLKGFNGLLSGLNYVQGGFNAFQSSVASIFSQVAMQVSKNLAPLVLIFEQLARIPGPAGDSARLAFAALSSATKFAGDAAVAYSEIQKEQERDFTRNANAIQGLQGKLGDLIGRLQHSKAANVEHSAALREGADSAAVFSKSIQDAGIKIGNGFDLIKKHSIKVDIQEVMEKSIDGFNRLKTAATASVPGFTSVGKAATSLFDDLEKAKAGVNGLASAFGGVSKFGSGMTISTPGLNVTQEQLRQLYRDLGFGGAGTSGGAGFFHSGGVVGWGGTKRMHSGGLMDGEVPIVAQTGEGIVSRQGMAALASINAGRTAGGGSSVVVNVDARGAYFDTPASMDRLATRVGAAITARQKTQGRV